MPSGPAEVIEDDRRVGEGLGQVGELRQLRVVQPGVEAEAARRQLGESPAEARVGVQAGRGIRVRVADLIAGVPAGGVADAAEPRAGGQVPIQNGADSLAEAKVGEAHDPRGDPGRSEAAAGTHGGDAVDELGLADRPHLRRAARAVHGHALDEHRGHHVVAAAGVRQQLVDEVAAAGMVPEVVVRVADGPLGLEDLFHTPASISGRDCTPSLG